MGKFLVFLLPALLFCSLAQGAVLIDTGAPSGSTFAPICRDDNYGLHCNNSVALKVNLSQTTNITEVQGYFLYYADPRDITVALYNNVDNLPGQELYNNIFSVGGNGWYGPGNLDWLVDAGSYWVSFEVRKGQFFSGGLVITAPYPIESAFSSSYGETWSNVGYEYAAGLILEGTPIAALPEPETYAIILAGLGVVGFAARRKHTQHLSIERRS